VEFLFELLFEFVIQIVLELLAEVGLRSISNPSRRKPDPWLAAFGYALLGAAAGGLSLLVFPQHITSEPLRIANLVLMPFAIGLAMMAMGAWRARRGDSLLRIDRFGCGYLFALSLALVRYGFAS
jgi:hypothetical protein